MILPSIFSYNSPEVAPSLKANRVKDIECRIYFLAPERTDFFRRDQISNLLEVEYLALNVR